VREAIGLTLENVSEAVRLIRPFAIDVNSGVEEEPGKKDHAKLLQLIGIVSLAESSQ
jgi:phosphoribosylanthranilate isomerase